jgi:ribosomal-protein-serine acetyltransferase
MSAPIRIPINDHLELRQRQPEDAEELFTLTDANRTYLRHWLPWLDYCNTPDDTRQNITASLKQAADGTGLAVSIWYHGRIVGVTGFNEIRKADRVGQIGYWLACELQGKGIMLSSVRALVDYGFVHLGLNRQSISAAVGNLRSRAIPERLGFRLEGISREAEWVYDHFKDLARYATTHGEWLEKHVAATTPSIATTSGQIRSMRVEDLTAVHTLWQTCEGVGLSAGDDLDSLATILERNSGLSAVALDAQGKIVGAVMAGHDARRGYLYHLAVDANHRGRGLGRALVDHARAGLRAAGIKRCTIVVFADNAQGAAFWKHLGWSTREDLRVMQIVP